MTVNAVHWLISAGLLNFQGLPIDSPVVKVSRKVLRRRTESQVKRDRDKIMEMLTAKKIMSRETYEQLKTDGYLANHGVYMNYSSFAVMCSTIKRIHMGVNFEANTTKVLKLIKKGRSRKEMEVELGLTYAQIASAIWSLKVKGVIQ